MDYQPELPRQQPPSMDDAATATIAYADVFDYPLTRDELVRWMLFDGKVPKQEKRFYYLPGRSHLIALRRKRATWQQEKWRIARRAAKILSVIPTIQLIGVTGGLAMDNAGRRDDIDLFFIVTDGTLWMSRLLATVAVELLGIRRRPKDTSVADKVCLNMFMTTRGLPVPTRERDCFSAHEVLQMRPLWEQGNIYTRFLKANGWARIFLPNAWKKKNNESRIMNNKKITNKFLIHYSMHRAVGSSLPVVVYEKAPNKRGNQRYIPPFSSQRCSDLDQTKALDKTGTVSYPP